MVLNTINVDELPALIRLMKKQNGNRFRLHGQPVNIFAAEGFVCVKYENGQWFHYDLIEQTWF